MKLNKKVVESMVVICMVLVLSITAVATDKAAFHKGQDDTEVEASATAGVADVLNNYEVTASEGLEEQVSIEKEEVATVTTSKDEEETETVELTQEELDWQNSLMPTVQDSLNVRAEGNENAAIVGKLYKGSRATIVEAGAEWTKITSGNVTGYVKNDYCVFGTDALAYAKANCNTVAQSTTGGLRVRNGQSTDAGVVTSLSQGQTLNVDTSVTPVEGWVAVSYKSNTCYVSADYVQVYLQTGYGLTLEEEAAIIAAAEEKKRQEAAAAAQTPSPGRTQGTSLAASADELTLLAAIIQCEAGGESYECQLAVGAVVMNRVKSPEYPNTIYGVIHQKGQFGPASSGKLERRLSKGVSSTAYAAAQEALNGVDNTGGAVSFKLTSSGHWGVAIGALVFY